MLLPLQQMLANRSTFVVVITAAPVGFSHVTIEAIGGGGFGFGSAVDALKASGGAGQYARSDANIAVTGGSTVVYYSVGAGGISPTAASNSWAQVGVNAAPTLSSTGCSGRKGTSASSATAGTGGASGGVGAVLNNGANGTVGAGSVGGGAGGYDAAGSGQTAGNDSSGLSAGTPMGGGTGGAFEAAGTDPGGAGGASATINPNGGVGRVRLLFTI
jgi:hypothetical protein